MKFSIAAVSSFVAAAVAASLPDAFTLVADGGKTLVTDGSNAFVGTNTNDKYSILILHGGAQSSQVTYTATGQTPTGWQNLYATQSANDAIALTIPHSGAIPEGASISGFGVNDQGQFTFNGKTTFGVQGQNGIQEVYFLGAGDGQFQGTSLTVKEFK